MKYLLKCRHTFPTTQQIRDCDLNPTEFAYCYAAQVNIMYSIGTGTLSDTNSELLVVDIQGWTTLNLKEMIHKAIYPKKFYKSMRIVIRPKALLTH